MFPRRDHHSIYLIAPFETAVIIKITAGIKQAKRFVSTSKQTVSIIKFIVFKMGLYDCRFSSVGAEHFIFRLQALKYLQ
jgi:hypothetical protein